MILPNGVGVEDIEKLLRRTGMVLEGAWTQLGCRLIDFKIEMGITSDGQLVVADVIDADSWRLRSADWQELSKQLFRDNVDMAQIANKYALVAQIVQQLRIPKQAIVVWRGSKNDLFPEIPAVAGINVVDIVLSGHKSPNQCLRKLEEVLTEYPEGGAILACIGMSNGLGPVLAARTSWPVIGVAMSMKSFPDDIWSSLRMPSQVPMATMMSPENAVLMALNILGQKNPVAYAERQLSIEILDN
jgi:phosphoribosylaminoimidazole carboxylase/phosphoribosylaminoimidazole-succinocarboxamide synthase